MASRITSALMQHTPLVETSRKITLPWYEILRDIDTDVTEAPQVVRSPTRLETQTASIPMTAIPTPPLASGLYRLSYLAQITQAATTSSSLTVTLSWVSGGVIISTSGAAMTDNTTATGETGSFLIEIDAATDVSYATTYVSVGATAMQYRLSVALEALPR